MSAWLSDDTSDSQISLHWSWKVDEIRLTDSFRRHGWRERTSDIAIVRRPETDRTLREKAETNTNERDEIAEDTELCVAP